MSLRTLSALALCALIAGCSGSGSVTPPTPPTPPPARGGGDDLKPYAEVIKDAETDDGLITLHLLEDGQKVLGEIPDSLFGREILVVSRIARTAEGLLYGGFKVNTQTVRLDRQGNDALLRTVQYNIVASDSLPIAQAVANSSFEPVIARLGGMAVREDTSIVVDMTPLFTTDVPLFGLPSFFRQQYQVRRLDDSRTFLERAAAYPINNEFRSVLTYQAQQPPTNSSTGTLSVEMAHSFVLLPEEPMRPRRYDPRVGFFTVNQIDYGLDNQQAETRRYVTRWRMEPSDVDAYRRGELVDPVKPIVYYIDPATPEKWRPYLKQGVDDWRVAFEEAGFSNAIRSADPPSAEEDPDWSPEDARYSVIRYFASDIQNAFGPHVHDPRSGEILESDIGWYHNVMNLLRNWFFVQTAAINPDARGLEFSDEVMGRLIRFVSAHEVGHTLGFPHNFISSNAYPVDSLRSPTFTATRGTAPSIMDYARFNYVAQPGDGVTNLMPDVGAYDKWVTKWGYTYFPDAESEEEERAMLQEMTAEALQDPVNRYGAQMFDPLDPRSQSEDLGDDAVLASTYGLANLKRIMPNLTDWAVDAGEEYASLGELHGQVVGQWNRYLNHVARNVAGVYSDTKLGGDDGVVYTPVPADKQREAVAWIVENGLTTQDWLLDADMQARFEPAGAANRILSLQAGVVARLLDVQRLGRLSEQAWRNPSEAYSPMDLFTDLRTGVWSELEDGSEIDATRRALHRAHISALASLLRAEAGNVARDPQRQVYRVLPAQFSDIQALARGELLTLQEASEDALRRYRNDNMGRLHLEDILARIEDALDTDD
ncbi:MAG: zinc-dependent metalloprotease [Bacteroidota bacterium]